MISFAKSLAWSCALLAGGAGLRAESSDLAIAIVYDTSGSMAGKVRGSSGAMEPKYQIARRALAAVITRLEAFAAGDGRRLQAGLFTFLGDGAQAMVPLGPFDAVAFRAALGSLDKLSHGTPLGGAVRAATQALWKVKAESRHVLVITDGENTMGPPPEAVIPRLQDECLKNGLSVYHHFIAFDVDAKVFARVKRQGVTLLGASDEAQLNAQLATALERNILLEKQ